MSSGARSKISHVIGLTLQMTAALSSVSGSTGEPYIVDFYQDADLWELCSCSCEDRTFRPFLCKHLCYCLRRMGLGESALEDVFFAPDQLEMYDLLSNAPNVVS